MSKSRKSNTTNKKEQGSQSKKSLTSIISNSNSNPNSNIQPSTEQQGYESDSLMDADTLREARNSILALEKFNREISGQSGLSDQQLVESSPILNLLNSVVDVTIRSVEKSAVNGKPVEPLHLVEVSKLLKQALLQTSADAKKKLKSKSSSTKQPNSGEPDDESDVPSMASDSDSDTASNMRRYADRLSRKNAKSTTVATKSVPAIDNQVQMASKQIVTVESKSTSRVPNPSVTVGIPNKENRMSMTTRAATAKAKALHAESVVKEGKSQVYSDSDPPPLLPPSDSSDDSEYKSDKKSKRASSAKTIVKTKSTNLNNGVNPTPKMTTTTARINLNNDVNSATDISTLATIGNSTIPVIELSVTGIDNVINPLAEIESASVEALQQASDIESITVIDQPTGTNIQLQVVDESDLETDSEGPPSLIDDLESSLIPEGPPRSFTDRFLTRFRHVMCLSPHLILWGNMINKLLIDIGIVVLPMKLAVPDTLDGRLPIDYFHNLKELFAEAFDLRRPTKHEKLLSSVVGRNDNYS